MSENVIDFNKKRKEKISELEKFNSGDFKDFDDFFRYCEIKSKSDDPCFSGEHILVLYEMLSGFDSHLLPKNTAEKLLSSYEKMPLPYELVMKDFLDEIQERRNSFDCFELDEILSLYK